MSILSFTKIDYDFKNISPLNNPAYEVLNFIFTVVYFFYGITKLLGYTNNIGP